MIIQDTDGRYMLDFLGERIKEATNNDLSKDIVNKAFKFVESQYIKYSDEKNEKLSSRYFRLLRYFLSRKNVWELS